MKNSAPFMATADIQSTGPNIGQAVQYLLSDTVQEYEIVTYI